MSGVTEIHHLTFLEICTGLLSVIAVFGMSIIFLLLLLFLAVLGLVSAIIATPFLILTWLCKRLNPYIDDYVP